DPESAEELLQEIIDEAPEFYSAYNQLTVAYQMQGEHEKARTLVEKTHDRFPDYLFARVALARMLIQDRQTEE
ncbi:tetratricopeptide repeat protein, partial [Candidatus Saccharibacteria bacterium]|nr:tetratricopeptide repeat protein [Candidatus Saccharibacteria bacterium]NIV03635.1 tetratricopeptide repeat protein [Calditrichia bacterium]